MGPGFLGRASRSPDPPGYRRYSQTDESRSTAVIVSEALAIDPDFPLEQFLRREFAERLAQLREIEAETA